MFKRKEFKQARFGAGAMVAQTIISLLLLNIVPFSNPQNEFHKSGILGSIIFVGLKMSADTRGDMGVASHLEYL